MATYASSSSKPSGVSSKKYEAFFDDDDSPRSYRTKHYSDDEEDDDSYYSEDSSYDYSRSRRAKPTSSTVNSSSRSRQSSSKMSVPPPRPRSRNPFSDAVTLEDASRTPSRSHRRAESMDSSFSDSTIETPKKYNSSRRLDPNLEDKRRKEEARRREEESRRREKEARRKEEEASARRRRERRRREEEERRRKEEEEEKARKAKKLNSDDDKSDDDSFSFDEASEDEAEKKRKEKEREREKEREKEKERERRHRHRSRHHSSKERTSSGKTSSSKHKSSRSKKDKRAPGVDTIDRLDATGLFGGAFHHDGPFDACNPHRNKNTKVAPVMAFPIDGPNSTIKGLGPNNTKEHTIDTVLGNGAPDEDEGLYTNRIDKNKITFSTGPVMAFDAKMKEEPVHGETTLGLGSSTFLEGAPASKVAKQEEIKFDQAQLGRKKSLSRRLLNNNNGLQPSNTYQPRRKSDDDVLRVDSGEKNSLLNRVKSLKVSRSKTQRE